MGLVITALSLALGGLLVLVGNPVQIMPRFMYPLRYVVVARWYRRLQAEYRIRRAGLRLTFLAAGLLLLWFLVAMSAPISADMLLTRVVLGVGLGGFLGWSLFCRRELLLGNLGIIGFYPNARLVVTWDNLAGYLLFTDKPQTIVLVDKGGNWVEAIPVANELEQREVELALLPYLPRLNPAEWPLPGLPGKVRRALFYRYGLLLLGTVPLLLLLVARFIWHAPLNDLSLIIAIALAIALPFYVLNWSQHFRMLHYSSLGHVSVAQLISLCQRCFYQAVCWQSGLHRRIYWGRDRLARVPSWEEFCKDFRHELKITPEIYHTCCRCLVGHLQAKDLYQIMLIPINPEQEG